MRDLPFALIELFYRGRRWLRNPLTGPLPRLRRVGGVTVSAIRDPSARRLLPRDLLAALFAPPRHPGPAPAARSRRSFSTEREAARRRLAGIKGLFAGHATRRPVVAMISDERLAAAAAKMWECSGIRPEDWLAAFAGRSPELLLVESAWYGNFGAWQYRIAWYAHPDAIVSHDLRAVLGWCASHGVPSVFWDTATGQFERFRAAARLFDLIVASVPRDAESYGQVPDRRGWTVTTLPSGSTIRDLADRLELLARAAGREEPAAA